MGLGGGEEAGRVRKIEVEKGRERETGKSGGGGTLLAMVLPALAITPT